METVTVNKQQLLQKLQQNREEHQEIVAEAKAGYKKIVLDTVQNATNKWMERLKSLESEDMPDIQGITFNLPKPVDNTRQFDQAIEMVQAEVKDEIELDSYEFARFWMNDWDWTSRMLESNKYYSTKAHAMSVGTQGPAGPQGITGPAGIESCGFTIR